MDETVLAIALAIASLIASPLIEGLKIVFGLMGVVIKDKAALWFTLGMSFVCAIVAMGIGGVFSPPYPTTPMEWVKLVGFSVGSIFTVATIVFKQLIQPAKERKEVAAQKQFDS